MGNAQRRHDISDKVWALLAPHLPGQAGQWGGIAKDNRLFVNAIFWVLRTGAPWRDLPPEYGKWGTVNQRFNRWRKSGSWEKILELLINDPDYEWLIIDASHIKVHPHAAGAKGGNQDMGRTKGGSTARYIWPWMRMVCQSEFLLQAVPRLIAHKQSP
jgi:transposase